MVRRLNTEKPVGTYHCPADFESATLIAFAYSHGSDADLWFSDTGCETLDNGSIGAAAAGHPAFGTRFASLVNKLAPPSRLRVPYVG